ncbi:hypothetical protein [Noviherbaspirillum sedimenti]|uniref:Uncharacterized protein n=1 Tax=Noviherbaspirillum sedimenti TaxID=2320865 RepID=A0A3A3G4X9_9BURK|nr:hypothetical protein [Noviherbaspirillum sedimenti]RJG01552.1 hypothetical protein D3878_08110 [Noviherbaspirillum sedimenti]
MDTATTFKTIKPADIPITPARTEIGYHAASQCVSLHCPLHVWVCDLNGDLVFATNRPAVTA